jgi:hypothetical protein
MGLVSIATILTDKDYLGRGKVGRSTAAKD